MKSKKTKKMAMATVASTLMLGTLATNVFAYGEYSVDQSTFKTDTDSSSEYQSWRSETWDTVAAEDGTIAKLGESADSSRIALVPGSDASKLNFGWYSKDKGIPAIKIWKDGNKSQARIITGEAADISAVNWQGETYAATNKVTVDGLLEKTTYYYQYTDNYQGDVINWSAEYKYATQDTSAFSTILTGDPQVGASGSSSDEKINDDSAARDTYNWNKTMQQALKTCPNAAFLLSAGDQIDKSGTSVNNKKTRESEYAGYLYPSVFRSLPIASTIGNHDMAVSDYSQHFNNPNATGLGSTAAGGDYYFSYGDVLFISLNSNNRNQNEHRQLMTNAINSHQDAKWKVVIFHSDIYGTGQPHGDSDAVQNRIIFAPLMDEFDIDVCLTGHDHTYSRTYQVLDGNVIDYDISNGSATNPEGTVYITTGSGSGSKYYDLLSYKPYYIAERTNACLPSFSTIDFTNNSLTIKTYDYNGNKYADDYTIYKTNDNTSVDDIINLGTEKLNSIDQSKYTSDSIANLQNAIQELQNYKNSYTTSPDAMVPEITNKYGTSQDRISGYGSVKNNEDKCNGTQNVLKEGLSSLVDKTVYVQNFANVDDYSINTISNLQLETEKSAVLQAIQGLKEQTETPVQPDQGNTTKPNDQNTNTSTGNKATVSTSGQKVKTGDEAPIMQWLITFLVAAIGTVAGFIYRKKAE